MASLQREHLWNGVRFTVLVNTAGLRRMRWTFETEDGKAGVGITGSGVDAAYDDARRAAEASIDGRLRE